MALLDYFRSGTSALVLPRGADLQAAADAAAHAQNIEIERQVYQRIRAFADTNDWYQTGAISNPNTGLLGPQDALVGTIPTAYRFLTDFQLAQLYAEPLARTICTEQPAWLAAAGHRITMEEGADQMATLDDRLGLSIACADAHGRANHLRGGGVLIDCDEEGDPPLSEPLDPRRVRRIHKLIVYGGLLLQVADWQQNAEGEPGLPAIWRPFAQTAMPRTFRLLPTFRQGGIPADRGGGGGVIHWTRILYFQGAPVPPDTDGMLACPSTHYCLSKLDLCWRSIRRWMTTATNAERIANTHGAWWMTIANKGALDSSAALNPGTGGGWVERMISLFNARKVFVGMPGDTIGNAGIALGGWKEIEQGAYVDASNSSLIPVPLLWQSLPAGFSDAEDTWRPQWDGRCKAVFRAQWAKNIARPYALQYYIDHGRAPAFINVDPGPWRTPTDKERADIQKTQAESLVALVGAGVITREEARTSFAPTFTVDFKLLDAPAPVVVADSADGVWIGLDVDAGTLPLSAAATAPGMRPDPWPHVTLLYLGAVRPGAMGDVLAAAARAAAKCPAQVVPVEVGELGDDAAQVVFLRRAGLDALATGLLRACAPAVQAEQFPRFVPHMTLGYGGVVAGLALPDAIPVRALCVRRGDVEIARYAVG